MQDSFSEHREKLGGRLESKVQLGFKLGAELDRTIVSLSGGALVFSMTFVDKLAPSKLLLPLLFVAWGFFAISMAAVILSMHAAQRLIQQHIRKFADLFQETDEVEREAQAEGLVVRPLLKTGIASQPSVGWFNLTALIAFMMGLILLGFFVGFNLWHSAPSVVAGGCLT